MLTASFHFTFKHAHFGFQIRCWGFTATWTKIFSPVKKNINIFLKSVNNMPWHYLWYNFKHSAVNSCLACGCAEVARELHTKRKTQIVKVLSEGHPTKRMGPKRRKTAHEKINIKILHAYLIGHSKNVSGIFRLKPFIRTSILQNSQCKLLP